MHMTHTKGVVLDHEPTNREIFEVLLDFKGRFDSIDQRFDTMDKRFDDAEEFVGEMKVEMEERFIKMGEKIDAVEKNTKEGFADVFHKMADVQNDVRRVNNIVDNMNDHLYRIEKNTTEDIVAIGMDVQELKKQNVQKKMQQLQRVTSK